VSAATVSAAPPPEIAGDAATPLGTAFVLLRLGETEFALPIEALRRVLRAPRITRLPHPPFGVVGVFALRGTVLPVLDLGLLLRQAPAVRPGSAVVAHLPGSAESVGLLVDDVSGLVNRDQIATLPLPPEAEASLPPGWAAGILALAPDRIATLLDPAALLSDLTRHSPAPAAGAELAKETG
jgi:purine-binding chemotaxis protein CheW